MASIGNLSATVTADISKFTAELARADNVARRFAAQTDKEFAKVAAQADKKFAGISASMTKGLLKGGLGALGIGTGAAFISREIREIFRDLEAVEGISPEARQSLYAFDDAISKLKVSVRSFVAGAIAEFADFGRNLGIAAGAMVYGNDAARDALKDLRLEDAALREAAIAEKLKPMTDALGKLQKDYREMGLTRGEHADALHDEANALADLADAQTDHAEKLKLQIQAQTGYNAALKEFRDLASQLDAADKRFERLSVPIPARTFEGVSAELESLKAVRAGLDALRETGDAGSGVTVERQLEVTNQMIELQREMNRLFDIQSQKAREVGGAIAGSFENAVFSGGKLRDMLKGIGDDMLHLLFRKSITEPLAGAIAGSLFNGSSTGLLGKIFGFADGGRPPVGQLSIVGEQGPELFVPDVAGRIIPNHALGGGSRGGGGGDNISVVYNIQAGVSRAELIPVLRAHGEGVIAEIQVRSRKRQMRF